jgi:hypothetical protein
MKVNRKHHSKLIMLAALCCFGSSAPAALITFESIPAFSFGGPFTESGFIITATSGSNAVFGADSNFTSNYFTFDGPSTDGSFAQIDLAPFNLISMDIGVGSWSGSPAVDILITGNLFGGGTVTANYSSVTAVQNISLNWTNLLSVTVSGSDDPAIDNILTSAVPEPGSSVVSLLLASGMTGVALRRKRS